MKSITITLLAAFMIIAGAAKAVQAPLPILNAEQVAKLDLNGKWSGKRNQYSWDKKSFIESFEYEFELKQDGDKITGTSTIVNANGEYAEMKLEGFIIGNKLHFREYEVKDAKRPEGKVWCYKSGELNFAKDGDNIRLIGATDSYMEVYNYPCSGGYTDLVKVDNTNNLNQVVVIDNSNTADVKDPAIDISVYPNPFIDNATISYNLVDDSKVKVEVYDISGKQVSALFEGSQKAGSYTLNFDGKGAASQSGIFVVKMTVNGALFSKQLVQIH